MSTPDQLKAPAAQRHTTPQRIADDTARAEAQRAALPMLWRVFAANAAVFAIAFALLALASVTIRASLRVDELVVLLVGLVVMLLVDLLLLRQALTPLERLVNVMESVDLLRPGQRATGFERSSSEVLALAHAFNEMLERLEQERRESSARVLDAQEAERLRIARELHDEIGQTLTAVALRAEHAAQNLGGEGAELSEVAEIARHSLEDVRRISRELRPEALDDLGLRGALIALCSRVEEQSGMRVTQRIETRLPALSTENELVIYRIAQEALTNAMRHAHATEVVVALRTSDHALVLSVHDNGRGLPQPLTAGTGLTGMRERAMLIDADLEIESIPGRGVAVVLRIGPPERSR